ncbi:MATE family efflux transporter [Dorea sp. Marseille-P4042]|uniref:MATE family efflux transporter n=1 Tax=Dorea sp. Marseille-P4042 TaxID=2080749 RepID=UPI001FA9391C|nr:MATE family efflux transporter [uncultured Dorea sp.]
MQQLFNSVGVAVVGRFAGSEALAAVGSNGAVINLLVTLFSGISLGSNVIIAGYIDEGNQQKIPSVVHTAVTLALISGILLLLLSYLLHNCT